MFKRLNVIVTPQYGNSVHVQVKKKPFVAEVIIAAALMLLLVLVVISIKG